MKKAYLYILILLLSPASILYAQTYSENKIEVINTNVVRDNDLVNIDLELDLRNLNLGSQEMITVTPVAISADNRYIYEFNPFIVTGSVRDKALNRSLEFGHITLEQEPQFIVRNNRQNEIVPLTLTLPYEEWVHNSRLEFRNDVTGCDCNNLYRGNYTALAPILPAPPVLNVAYITPPAEAVKQRSETHSARINFEVGKYQILRHFKNNAQVLDEVSKIINEIQGDENLTVTEFHITGYASPEGNEQSNMTLSKNRAESFVRYLAETHRIAPSQIRTDWKGEDWEGLRKMVASLSIQDKQQILDILNNESNVANRKRRLQQLSGGVPYRTLLREHYPLLRRNDYTISYVTKNFDVNEAKVIIRTKPQHLSQNEMYLVANSYPKESREFKETFDIINRYYPESDVARLNSASYELEHGSMERAITLLQAIQTPEAWNNLGIAYYKQNNFEQARLYFSRAAQAGLQSAQSNLEALDRSGGLVP